MKCKNCNSEVAGQNFCPSCGTKLYYRGKAVEVNSPQFEILYYYGAYLLFIPALSIWSYLSGSQNSIWFPVLFISLVILTSLPNLKLIKRPIIQFKPKASTLLLNLALAISCAFIVQLVSVFLQTVLNIPFLPLIEEAPFGTMPPLLYSIIISAAVPAIFEEIGMRALLFNISLKYTNIKNTIVITGILFAVLHFTIISFLWLIPLGLYLGYLRGKYRTIWYGVIFHFLYNSSLIIMEHLGLLQ